jgi:hypothetical protein
MSNFLQAARHTDPSSPLPHQDAAWQWAWEQFPKEKQEEFLEMFRAAVPSKDQDGTNSWQGIATMAKEAGAKYPELAAAQWAIESGWGKYTSGTNNYFGLKGSGKIVETKEVVNGKEVSVRESFINFPSIRACVNYLVTRWYRDFDGFKGVNNAVSRDDAARQLVKEGYATDPFYAEKLIKTMNANAPASIIKPAPPTSVLPTLPSNILLTVPYEYQNDNASGTGYRECFSSAAAMVAKFYGKIKNDDEYNKVRAKFGDTTDGNAHVKALKSLGLNARFATNGTAAMLEKELRAVRPVLVGWLHKGPASAPSGSGHWSVVTGFSPSTFIHNDPNGEADMVNGGYVNHSKGEAIAYSRQNWLKRWEVDGPGTGWYIAVER